jgi:hypothetical protein
LQEDPLEARADRVGRRHRVARAEAGERGHEHRRHHGATAQQRRKRNPTAQGNAYLKAVLYTAKRPLPAVHAMISGVVFFPALAAALISSWGA